MTIDLSQLKRPTIAGLLKTPETVAAEMAAWYSQKGYALTAAASDPTYRAVLAFAQREAALRRTIYDAALGLSLAYAVGDELDNIGGSYYGVTRYAGETDTAYRQRVANTPERFAIGLSGAWYERNALAVPGVLSAQLHSPTPGVIDLYIQADADLKNDNGDVLYTDGEPTAALLAAVTSAVTAADTRQQTDKVTVKAGTIFYYVVVVKLMLESGADAAIVQSDAATKLMAVLAARNRFGGEISKEIIAGAVFVSGVKDATIYLHTPTSGKYKKIVAAIGQYPWPKAFIVEIK